MKTTIARSLIFALIALASQPIFADKPANDESNSANLAHWNQHINRRLEQQISARLQSDMMALAALNEIERLANAQDSDGDFVRPSMLPNFAAK